MAAMRAAQTYTIESIMAMKERFTDPPYPGFDLLDVCRKRSAQGPQRLPRGDNAWTVSKPRSSDEVIRKLIRGTLNKLTPEKYGEIVEGLNLDELLEDSAMEIAIDLIFAKALQEPGYSRIYAKFCLDIAKYEVSKTSPQNADADRKPPRSHFRNHIVARAQQEFQRREQMDPNLPADVRNEMQTAEVKRKRANITFVGQLYMHKVLSSSVMHRIISSLLHYDTAAKIFPEEIDIEVLCELLETIGKTIDLTEDGRVQMDQHFESLGKLLKLVNTKQIPFGAKVKFKLMDTLELRDNDWVPRVERTGGMTPATLKELQQRENSGTGAGLVLSKTVKSPTSKTPNRKFAPQFPSAPTTASNDNAGPSPPPNPWNRAVSMSSLPSTPARAPSSTPKPAETPKIPFDERVSNLLREYLETRESMRDWDQPFYDYPDVTEENVSDLVAASAIRDACMGTRANAQVDCCQFLVQGIGIGKIPLLTGVGRVIVQAVQEDFLSDVPLFYSRLVHILEHCCGGETVDVYRDAIVSTFFAFDQLRTDESVAPIPELLKLWECLPKQGVEPSVIGAVVASRGGEQSANELVVALISFLISHDVVTKESLGAWLESTQAQSSPDLRNLLSALTS